MEQPQHTNPAPTQPAAENAKSEPPKADKANTERETAANSQRELQDKFVQEVQQLVRNLGLDIAVSVSSLEHQLVFTSDYFQDLDARELFLNQMSSRLRAGRKNNACSLGIWFIRADYSKGLLSSNVGRPVSLGCSEKKQAREDALNAERGLAVDVLQKELNSDPQAGNLHVTQQGDELVLTIEGAMRAHVN